MQKHGHECTISKRNQVGRHGLYSGHYSSVFVAPKNTQNAETKCQSGAVPILLLAILTSTTSAYTSLGVLQGLNPRHQLLKASVYHSATSAVGNIILNKGGVIELATSMIFGLPLEEKVIAWKQKHIRYKDNQALLGDHW
jgi:hypothetical protein